MAANAYLSEGAATDDRQWLEVPRRYLLAHLAIQLGLLVQDVLLDELLLRLGQVQRLHLLLQDVPRLFTVALVLLELLVLRLDVGLG